LIAAFCVRQTSPEHETCRFSEYTSSDTSVAKQVAVLQDRLRKRNMIRTLNPMEYITPLREGGSLPAVIRADDGETYAMKFIGAGQGAKVLIAELIAGETARELGFNVPEIVLLNLDPTIGHTEPDAEIQDLLRASSGINLGLKFLTHSSAFNLLISPKPSEFASKLVWFDAFVTNVDRTPRNVNMLIHQGKIWLIDHGASLYFHHNWQDHVKQSETPFPLIKDHVLLPLADKLADIDRLFKKHLNRSIFENIVAQIPDQWLESGNRFKSLGEHRRAYVEYLEHRLEVSQYFVEEANSARAQLV
jgi:hypothetical protein